MSDIFAASYGVPSLAVHATRVRFHLSSVQVTLTKHLSLGPILVALVDCRDC